MKKSTIKLMRDQQKFLLNQGGLFNKIFDAIFFKEQLKKVDWTERNRIFTPEILLFAFISQILDQDHSCKSAVSHVIALLKKQGKEVVSSATGAYCRARLKMPEHFLKSLSDSVCNLLNKHSESFLWKGLNIKLIDGSELKVADTKENKKEFQRRNKKSGALKCRIVGIFSLSNGSLLNLAVGPYLGKGSGEQSLFRKMVNHFGIQDLALMDRLFCSYFDLAYLLVNQVNFIVRKKECYKKNIKVIKKLGRNDELVELTITVSAKQVSLEKEYSDIELPNKIVLRKVCMKVKRKRFRPKNLELLTSLLNNKIYTKNDLSNLYFKRWNVEVDF